MFKKITALILAILLCLCALASCSTSGEEVPDGMKSAYISGEPFRLYIPEGWVSNTRSGVSGGYSPLYAGVSVSARYDSNISADTDVAAYLEECSAKYAETLDSYVNTGISEALLGGKDARRLTYNAKDEDGVSMTCSQFCAKDDNGIVISLYTYCPTELLEKAENDIESVRANFVILNESPVIKNDEVIDKNTPAGMKIASDKNAAYRLYVPTSWTCEAENLRSEARVASDGSNVTVTLYEPSVSMSIEDYFDRCAEDYQKGLRGYTLIEANDRTVSGKSAKSYTYSAEYGNAKYRIMQTVFSDGKIMYSITYTALDENFDTHMTDVELILNSFRFR
ncbi:MAG: DUF1795 domain-containing protein [Ruminococcaceae bacterium]|nr:DUF1795 domain-containing protein [Oscillospiraceae bacterium]